MLIIELFSIGNANNKRPIRVAAVDTYYIIRCYGVEENKKPRQLARLFFISASAGRGFR